MGEEGVGGRVMRGVDIYCYSICRDAFTYWPLDERSFTFFGRGAQFVVEARAVVDIHSANFDDMGVC